MKIRIKLLPGLDTASQPQLEVLTEAYRQTAEFQPANETSIYRYNAFKYLRPDSRGNPDSNRFIETFIATSHYQEQWQYEKDCYILAVFGITLILLC